MPQEFTLQPSPYRDGGRDVNTTVPGYEVGFWTPVPFFSSESGSAITVTASNGRYRRIGDAVHVWFNTTFSSKGTAIGNLYIRGLPIQATLSSGFLGGGSVIHWTTLATAAASVPIVIATHSTYGTILSLRIAAGAVTSTRFLDDLDCNNTSGFEGFVTYFV